LDETKKERAPHRKNKQTHTQTAEIATPEVDDQAAPTSTAETGLESKTGEAGSQNTTSAPTTAEPDPLPTPTK
jgi:hypothetical protein